MDMKYECKENDAVIELGEFKDELLIYIKGDGDKTIIGLEDLKQALNLFDVVNCKIMDKAEKLEQIVKLFSKCMFYGDWKWETPNERTIEMLMTDLGFYPYENEDDMIKKSDVSEDLYREAIKKVPTRQNETNENFCRTDNADS